MIPALLLWVAMGQDPGARQNWCPPKQISTIDGCMPERTPPTICGSNCTVQVPSTGEIVKPKPEPLKCDPRYEYNESYGVQNCHADPDHPNSNIAICAPVVNCKPLMHTVTEKEWQELMERLKKLEHAQTLSVTKYIYTPGSDSNRLVCNDTGCIVVDKNCNPLEKCVDPKTGNPIDCNLPICAKAPQSRTETR